MPSKGLKWLRVAIAAAVLAGLTAAMVDFRGLVPWQLGRVLAEIQFVPSLVALISGASLSLACLVIAIVTMAAGRIYCSALCPLGILQDVVIRLAGWLKRKSRPVPYARPQTWVRQTFLWAAVVAGVAGFGSFGLSLLDPYSNFARIASDVFRPLTTLANNSAASIAGRIGWKGLFHVQPHWAGIGALALPLFMLLLIVALAAWRGRLYCNTVCPVGTILGWLSQRALFRLQIDKGACRKCAACLRACKAQCIDLRSGAIDFSRCVACFNCMDACGEQAIGYRLAPSGEAAGSAPLAPAAHPGSTLVKAMKCSPQSQIANRKSQIRPAACENSVDLHRRAFLSQAIVGVLGATGIGGAVATDASRRDRAQGRTGASGKPENYSAVICPPGSSSIQEFLDRCTACHLCITECPTAVLQPAFLQYGWSGLMKPRMDYSVAFCNFDCRRCGEVCPDGAISLLGLATKYLTKIGEAQFDRDACVVVTNGTDCAACSEHCPTKAVSTTPYVNKGKNLRLPSVNKELCVGCGACEYACPAKPAKAIKVTGLLRHGWAKKNIEPKATLPKSSGDFPF